MEEGTPLSVIIAINVALSFCLETKAPPDILGTNSANGEHVAQPAATLT